MKTDWTVGAYALLGVAMVTSMHAQTAANHFVLDKSVQAPGSTLKAGSYTVAVVDSLSDRSVLRLDSDSGKQHLLLLGVRNAPLNGTPGQPVLWDAKVKGKQALRGFIFPDGRSVELVYPKADAVALAGANHQGVVAVDTASEGRPALEKLSSRDMQLVSLWLLTPTRVGPDAKQVGMEAKRFEPNGTTQTAQTSHPAPPTSGSAPAPVVAPAARPAAPIQVARVDAPPQVKPHTTTGRRVSRLPQTGSALPLFYLVSTTALAGAAGLRLRRQRRVGA